MSIIDTITSLFAPDNCLGCGREGRLVCTQCSLLLPSLPGRCFGCHQSIGDGVGCADCVHNNGFHAMGAIAGYRGLAQTLVAHLKFHGNQAAARIIAQSMTFQPTLGAVVTHVPATTTHIRQRGYDQAQLIAQHVARFHELPCATLLRRIGQTHQLGADRHNRLEQLAGTVSVRNARTVEGAHIILIDDVLTTGATLRTSAMALRQAGAAKIEALVFAQA